jgi:hypothetical protein
LGILRDHARLYAAVHSLKRNTRRSWCLQNDWLYKKQHILCSSQAAQRGQISGKVTEEALIKMLEQVNGAAGGGGDARGGGGPYKLNAVDP